MTTTRTEDITSIVRRLRECEQRIVAAESSDRLDAALIHDLYDELDEISASLTDEERNS